MQVTIEQINGKPHTIIWYTDVPEQQIIMDNDIVVEHQNGTIWVFEGDKIYATALPSLPRHPKPEDAWLLDLYKGHRIYPWLKDGELEGEFIGFFDTQFIVNKGGGELDSTAYPTITHCLHNGSRVSVAIEGGE